MDKSAYAELAALEEGHWWFVGRRKILNCLIESCELSSPTGTAILEAGCGSGGNLDMLSHHGQVSAFELDAPSREIANKKTKVCVVYGALPNEIPFREQKFDLIVLSDVLEHIEDDRQAMIELSKLLKPGGKILLTVPAMKWLWSGHDVYHHHYRRYSKSTLKAVIVNAGLRVDSGNYFNCILFPLAVLKRIADRFILMKSGSSEKAPPSLINRVFCSVFSFERHFISRFPIPFGLSLFMVASLEG